jgi:hypothetical protein
MSVGKDVKNYQDKTLPSLTESPPSVPLILSALALGATVVAVGMILLRCFAYYLTTL